MSDLIPLPLLRALAAKHGAWSTVTEREEHDSQLTLDALEKEVLFFRISPALIWRGASREAPRNYRHSLPVYQATQQVNELSLPINFPKEDGEEVRLYFRKNEFNPRAGDCWFIFIRSDDRLCIGWMSPSEFQALAASSLDAPIDDDDSDYQRRIDLIGIVPKLSDGSGRRYSRDARFGYEALECAGYQCEIDPSHWSFVSARTSRPYMEAHHIVPIYAARHYPEAQLDCRRNIACLCPNCHRYIHYGMQEERERLASRLLSRRRGLLENLGIPYEIAVSFYSGSRPLPEP